MATPIKITPTLKDESSLRFNRELLNASNSKTSDSSKARIELLVSKVLQKSKISR